MNPEIKKKNVKIVRREIMVNIIGRDRLKYSGEENFSVDDTISHWIKAMDERVSSEPDIIVLPEVSDIYEGVMSPETKRRWLAMRGDSVLNAFRDYAKKHHTYLVYPTYRSIGGDKFQNSSILIDREGDVVAIYNKVFPTIGEMEFGIVPGSGPVIAETDFGRIGFAICFDLNFWELLEGYAKGKPDVIAFSGMYHGGPMQTVWAYRSKAFMLTATAGYLEKNIIAPDGEIRRQEYTYYDSIVEKINTNCTLVHLDYNRAKIMKTIDKYGRRIHMHCTSGLGSVLLTSVDESLPIAEVVRDMDLEPFADYYKRSFDMAASLRPGNTY